MRSELRPVVKLARARAHQVDGRTVYAGRVGAAQVKIVQIGVGPASARHVTEWALKHFQVDHVVVCGIAGGLAIGLRIGAVVVPEAVMDLRTRQRYASAPISAVKRTGLVATADHLIVDPVQLSELEALGAIAVDMELSGVAAACEVAQLPWTAFRVISDRPAEHQIDADVMSLLRPDGTADIAHALRFMITHPGRISTMVRLGRNSSMAAAKAARIALAALGSNATQAVDPT
jgi:nucleoside phosphorylase